jgi:BirA family biotin operon repressor/biotin-[acetyl-CoA-carboxylase] ligase
LTRSEQNATQTEAVRQRVAAALAGPATCLPVHVVAATGSTNADLMDPARHADTPACVLLALDQTEGRGRNGRDWLSDTGSLTFSLRWPFARSPAQLLGLPLAVAVAVCQGLEDLGVRDVGIKWPNDLLRRDRKVGGVLVEVGAAPPLRVAAATAYASSAVIGIGLNVQLAATLAERLDRPAGDLQSAGAQRLGRELVLASLLNRLVPALCSFERDGFAGVHDEWTRRALWIGQAVRLGEDVSGQLLGVDLDGALRISTESGVVRGVVGDLSLRRAGS